MASFVHKAVSSADTTCQTEATSCNKTWWKNSTVYQIYPSSFKDSSGDGIGDIPGIISCLDYIASLGVDIIWLCPMYDSPHVDNGYDVADYENIYAPYGTLADMVAFIDGCHDRGMRIIIDLVVNHTSDQHEWFKESRSSVDHPKRAWYIWKPARYTKNGHRKPPNNWRSYFGGSAWQWDEHTQEYYLHLFAPEQPDLNWENEQTRNEVYKSAMEFWLYKGVDGFRIDTVNLYSKTPGLPDAPVVDASSDWQSAVAYHCNGPRMHEYLQEMNAKVLSRFDCMTVGELPSTPDQAKVLQYVSAKEKQLNMVFQFDVVDLGQGRDQKYDTDPLSWTLPDLKAALLRSQGLISGTDGWTTAFLENHDQARSISRFASDDEEYRERSGKMLAIMLAALSGTLFIYQGQEIGMINMPKDWDIDEYKDVESSNYFRSVSERTHGDQGALSRALTAVQHLARDHARLPMQWDESPNAGFTTGTPWMRTHDAYKHINVKSALADKSSLLHFWKNLLSLRKGYADLLIYGDFEIYDMENVNVFTFAKATGSRIALIALNFSADFQTWSKPEDIEGHLDLLVSNVPSSKTSMLAPWEGRLYYVK
ncbi:hypothetical protein LTR10_011792 [Elasticomyces elasticus]|uniref:Glycosyl hydrolase family 13 catalytic domain-containing protein n=1 Tax=Exophiala sideris TaxID=1016849 RepID=A0ABR0JDF3_9EURO|nr:hypothetical protein LTR10_011792 [Elasticomyces elasticus]KAK5031751.1 hypothetical protein LTS07_004371 [Exophiala sideris]KAK5040680.1 hypothetical protein LTR13_002980 [Exophiala sideris]KAK5061986.1 hypothetical protein LTR69_005170 [Exophiala sideris]KAK5184686.1 hypothetical protein LTR44_003361 [Eurotiomycetes sp. CCFEE 6388]